MATQMGFHKLLETQILFKLYTVNGLTIMPFHMSKESKACRPLNMFNGLEHIIYTTGIVTLL